LTFLLIICSWAAVCAFLAFSAFSVFSSLAAGCSPFALSCPVFSSFSAFCFALCSLLLSSWSALTFLLIICSWAAVCAFLAFSAFSVFSSISGSGSTASMSGGMQRSLWVPLSAHARWPLSSRWVLHSCQLGKPSKHSAHWKRMGLLIDLASATAVSEETSMWQVSL